MATTEAERGTLLAPALVDCARRAVLATFEPIYGKDIVFKASSGDGHLTDGVVGIISLVGDVTWSLIVGLPKDCAVGLARKFAGFEIAFGGPDMGDIIGEIANIIAGDAAAKFESAGVKVNLSLPAVARGDDIEMVQRKCMNAVCMHFECPDGLFWMKVTAGSPHSSGP